MSLPVVTSVNRIDISFRGIKYSFAVDFGSRFCKSGIGDLDSGVSELFNDFYSVNGYCSGLASEIDIAYDTKRDYNQML